MEESINLKRTKYLSWDAYFMSIAFMSSLRSKDPSIRHGACIVDKNKHIIGTGYSGFPKGCSDDVFPWGREGEPNNTKYPYVVHAEINAILNSIANNLSGSKLYLYSQKGYYPCSDCAKSIIQSGISEVIMPFTIKDNTDVYDWTPTKEMFKCSGVKIVELDFDCLEKEFDFIALELKQDLAKMRSLK
jgi:dCMP deaminase